MIKLSFVFLPLLFVASFLGVNTAELVGGGKLEIWKFCIVAMGLTVATWVWGNWKGLRVRFREAIRPILRKPYMEGFVG